ncbi:hypothetical protein [Sinorhizobium fredii]|uniref:hypothetical protein n=1 Tax=Rhizobium fredii TaxID=380 RepID=UPI00056D1793|nr:hypothetical protein [Sinorhizobium fredii]
MQRSAMHFIGHNKARLEARPDRFFLACAILALLMALFLSAGLATSTAFKKEWQFKAEARV